MPPTSGPSAPSSSTMLKAYRTLQNRPFGKLVFSRIVCWKAPYFASIRPTFQRLEPGYGEVTAPNRRAIRNHLGTVHAIACCNIAELVGGSTLDVTLPPTHRWIPKGMAVQYLAKAATDLRAVATINELSDLGATESREIVVPVDVLDTHHSIAVHADITMWVSPRNN